MLEEWNNTVIVPTYTKGKITRTNAKMVDYFANCAWDCSVWQNSELTRSKRAGGGVCRAEACSLAGHSEMFGSKNLLVCLF